jgi:3-phenylpropionate/cinnamic acid dioxygenase small subunit
VISRDVHYEIEQFLYHEALLLEENRFAEWLALFTDDAHYRMPVRRAVQPGGKLVAGQQAPFYLFDDDKASLELRTMRLETGTAHSEAPLSVTLRLITNVMTREMDDPASVEATSRFHVHQERLGRHTSAFVGKRRDLLRKAGGSWQIARREVELAQTILPSTISIFL